MTWHRAGSPRAWTARLASTLAIALGVFAGATLGARHAHRVDARVLRALFLIVLGWTAFQMARRAIGV